MEPYTHQGEENTLNKGNRKPSWLKYLMASPCSGLICRQIYSIMCRGTMTIECYRRLAEYGLLGSFGLKYRGQDFPADGLTALLDILDGMSEAHEIEVRTVHGTALEIKECIRAWFSEILASLKKTKPIVSMKTLKSIDGLTELCESVKDHIDSKEPTDMTFEVGYTSEKTAPKEDDFMKNDSAVMWNGLDPMAYSGKMSKRSWAKDPDTGRVILSGTLPDVTKVAKPKNDPKHATEGPVKTTPIPTEETYGVVSDDKALDIKDKTDSLKWDPSKFSRKNGQLTCTPYMPSEAKIQQFEPEEILLTLSDMQQSVISRSAAAIRQARADLVDDISSPSEINAMEHVYQEIGIEAAIMCETLRDIHDKASKEDKTPTRHTRRFPDGR